MQSGSLFHHFKTKEDVLFAIMEEVISIITANLRQALAEADTPHGRIRALIRTELAAVHGHTKDAMTVLVYEWRNLTPDRQQEILEMRDTYENLWLTTLEEAEREGLLAIDPFTIRRLLVGALSWTVNWYKVDGAMDLETLADKALTMVLTPD